jgi:hypothetical protein
MSKPIIFSIVESAKHPHFSHLYEEMGYEEVRLTSIRKAMQALKNYSPTFIVAEFFYAFGTNYSSNHISNLDSLLIALQKYPNYQSHILFLVSKQEAEFVSKLEGHYDFSYHAKHVLIQPVMEQQIKVLLS